MFVTSRDMGGEYCAQSFHSKLTLRCSSPYFADMPRLLCPCPIAASPDFHDAAMIAYLILTLPWMWGTIRVTRPTPEFPQAPGLATCLVNEDKGGTLADAEAPITSPGIRQRRAAARTDELEPSEDIPPSGISESRKSSVAALSRASHRR